MGDRLAPGAIVDGSMIGVARDEAAGRSGRWALLVGLLVYLAAQLAIVVVPIVDRPVPPGTTDSYMYLSKAAQLRVCLRQTCPALADLKAQTRLDPKTPSKLARHRSVTYHRAIYQYNLLYTASLAGLNATGIGWELALIVVSVAGAVIIALGVAWLLAAAFGAGPAGLALVLLAFAVYPGFHGTHWIVPTNIALGLGLMSWAAVLARPPGLGLLLIVLLLAMVWMHTVGAIFGAIALLLYLLLVARGNFLRWWVLVLGSLAILSPWIAGLVIDSPALSYRGIEVGAGWTFTEGVVKNARAAWTAVYQWLIGQGGSVIVLVAIVALLVVRGRRAGRIRLLAGIATVVTAASLLFVFPSYAAELFYRLWVPFVIVMTGVAGFAIWHWIAAILGAEGGWSVGAVRASGRVVSIAACLAVVLSLSVAAIGGAARGASDKIRYMRNWGLMPLDRGQPGRVLAAADKARPILYRDDLSLYFYTLHGGFGHRTVYAPAVAKSPLAERYRRAAAGRTVAVGTVANFYGYLPFARGRPIAVAGRKGQDWKGLALLIDAGPEPVRLVVHVGTSQNPARVRLEVPAGSGWRPVTLPSGASARILTIERTDGGGRAWLLGLRVKGVKTAWPWDRGIALAQSLRQMTPGRVAALVEPATGATASDPKSAPKQNVRLHRFRLRDLAVLGCRSVRVLEDRGATVAAEVDCAGR